MSRKDLDIHEIRQEVYRRDADNRVFKCMYHRSQPDQCEVTGWDNLVMAHRISRTKGVNYVIQFWHREFDEFLKKKEAGAILNHKLNLVTSCKNHNQLFLIDSKPLEVNKLLHRIKLAMDGVPEDMIDETMLSGNMQI